jgi:hypothetical protein
MPYKSDAQRRFAHTKAGMKAMGKKVVKEFDKASKGKKLPEKKTMKSSDGMMKSY